MQTNNIYDYKEHYQQQQHPHQHQEMQQYGYPLPSNSSSQLTLPLTRSLYHSSSMVSPLQSSYVHNTANSRHSLNHATSNTLPPPFSLAGPDLTYQEYQHSRRNQTNSRNNTRRKYRNKHERNERKQKRTQKQQQQQQQQQSSCETSFEQELGMPESYKISYPHYYEEDNCDDYDVASDSTQPYSESQQYHNNGKPQIKRYQHDDNTTPPNKYTNPELLFFRDQIGQEIDV